MKVRFYILIGIVCFVFLPVSIAIPQSLITQKVRLSSSPNPLGSGARALGMGNAFMPWLTMLLPRHGTRED